MIRSEKCGSRGLRKNVPSNTNAWLPKEKFNSIIVPPPSKIRVFARIFGFAAYFVGLFSVIAIFIALLTVQALDAKPENF